MAFTEAEKVDIRRYCGYPFFGDVNTTHFGYRYFTYYGQLEYRMNHLSDAEEAVVRSYLGNLQSLESAIPTTSDNLDTAKAAVWTHNPAEQDDRERLFSSWRLKLANLFGIPFGEASSSTIALRV